jgi:arylformamidase
MLYDLSPPVSPGLAVWPGDTPPSREILQDLARGDTVTLSTLRATVHLGSHADAPSHYGMGAPTMEQQPLEVYLGECQVLRVAAERNRPVTRELLAGPIVATRVLLVTGTAPDPAVFNRDFAALAPELIDDLHERGVRLVGVDTPSVDPADSKTLPAHHRCLAHDMAILEGLTLADVPEGRYELIALPLRLVGFDASPVRAVLRSLR